MSQPWTHVRLSAIQRSPDRTSDHFSICPRSGHGFTMSTLGPYARCHDPDMLLGILEKKGLPAEPLKDYVNAFRCVFPVACWRRVEAVSRRSGILDADVQVSRAERFSA